MSKKSRMSSKTVDNPKAGKRRSYSHESRPVGRYFCYSNDWSPNFLTGSRSEMLAVGRSMDRRGSTATVSHEVSGKSTIIFRSKASMQKLAGV